MKKLVLLLIYIIPFQAMISQEKFPFAELLPVGQQAPDWELINSKGELIKLSDYKGNIILLDFWASWCAPCIRAQPTLNSIHHTFKNVVVLGVNVQEVKEIDLSNFKKENGLSYELIKGSEEVVKDYRVEVLPVVYLIDEKGKILYAGLGYNEKKKAELLDVLQRTQK